MPIMCTDFENLVSPNNKICSRNTNFVSVRMKFSQSNFSVWHFSTSLKINTLCVCNTFQMIEAWIEKIGEDNCRRYRKSIFAVLPVLLEYMEDLQDLLCRFVRIFRCFSPEVKWFYVTQDKSRSPTQHQDSIDLSSGDKNVTSLKGVSLHTAAQIQAVY